MVVYQYHGARRGWKAMRILSIPLVKRLDVLEPSVVNWDAPRCMCYAYADGNHRFRLEVGPQHKRSGER